MLRAEFSLGAELFSTLEGEMEAVQPESFK
jgi:hypothetical protein